MATSRSSWILVAAAVFAAPRLANATPNFPGEVERHYGLSYAPTCNLCHAVGKTPNKTTVSQPFGKALLAEGVMPNDIKSLDAGLDALKKKDSDVDGDKTSDFDELKNHTDPNQKGGGELTDVPALVYGCGAELAGRSSAPWLGAGLTAVALALATRRRRR